MPNERERLDKLREISIEKSRDWFTDVINDTQDLYIEDAYIQGYQSGATSESGKEYWDPVGFLAWVEDEGYTAVWSTKYKIRRYTKDEVLVNGSDNHYDNHVKNGIDAEDLYEKFKSRK